MLMNIYNIKYVKGFFLHDEVCTNVVCLLICIFCLAESDERIFAIRCQGGNLYEGQYGTIEKNPRGPFRIFL